MKTKKNLTFEQRALIVQLHKMHWSMQAIAKEINCFHSTVSDTIKVWQSLALLMSVREVDDQKKETDSLGECLSKTGSRLLWAFRQN